MKTKWRMGPRVLGLIFALSLIAAACGDTDEVPTTTQPLQTTTTAAPPADVTTTTAPVTTTTEAPFARAYGGQAILGFEQEPPTLNNFLPGGSNFIVSIVGQAYWVGITDIDGFTLEQFPDVIEEIPSVENGGVVLNADGTMTISYKIVDAAQWADGTPISGDDFKFTYDTVMRDDLPTSKVTWEDIIPESIVVGPKTFEYTMTAPNVLHLTIFTLIIPKHDVEGSDFAADWNDTMWVSAGPFNFSKWQKGEFIELTRNDNFWKTDPETGQQLPYLDTVVFRFINDPTAIVNAFKAREIDVFNPPPDTGLIQELQALESEGARVEVATSPIWEHLLFNFHATNNRNEESLNGNLNYRKAVAHALNKQRIVDDVLLGQVEPLSSHMTAWFPSWSQSEWAQYDYNVDTAKEFLAAACADVGRDCAANPPQAVFTTTSNNPGRAKIAELVQLFLGDVGIEVDIQLEDSSLFFGETAPNGKGDLEEWAWVGAPTLDNFMGYTTDVWNPDSPGPEGGNWYFWGDENSLIDDENTARVRELVEVMKSSVNEDELRTAAQEQAQILADQVVFVPLYQRLDPGVVWADEIGNYKHNVTSAADTWNIELWYRVDL